MINNTSIDQILKKAYIQEFRIPKGRKDENISLMSNMHQI